MSVSACVCACVHGKQLKTKQNNKKKKNHANAELFPNAVSVPKWRCLPERRGHIPLGATETPGVSFQDRDRLTFLTNKHS